MLITRSRRRAGITLTEILISILIMGVGMVSLATLFPLGLLRMRDANRMTRSALLAETAMNEISSRNLLVGLSFKNPSYTVSPWNPWLYDTPSPGVSAFGATGFSGQPTPAGVSYSNLGTGLPVAYDPLWIAYVFSNLSSTPAEVPRFGSGLGFLQSGGASYPSAYGLQRVTNLAFGSTTNGKSYNYNWNSSLLLAQSIFVSPEDIVFQSKVATTQGTTTGTLVGETLSTVVPDMSMNAVNLSGQTVNVPSSDWRYSWMFTGHQTDNDGTTFEGQIVIFENRQFSYDPITSSPGFSSPYTVSFQAAGETVVQAIFGYSPNVNAGGYGQGSSKTILLRWPTSVPDPDVKVGSWIADVTYERSPTASATLFGAGYPGQRCNWYQIIKRSDPAFESAGAGLRNATGGGQFRAMTVWISSSVQAYTQNTGQGAPGSWVVNAALVCPNVVNVFPRTIFTR